MGLRRFIHSISSFLLQFYHNRQANTIHIMCKSHGPNSIESHIRKTRSGEREGGENMNEQMKIIALAVVGLKYSEWCKVREAVEKAFASERAKVNLDNSEAVERLLKLEL
nr:MAG TPA: hypothetical protein [Caudoviricetes sp.]